MTDPGGRPDARLDAAVPDDPPVARSIIERVGLALVALVMAVIFGGLAAAAWIGGEVFLAAMAAAGALMTVWAAVANLRRG